MSEEDLRAIAEGLHVENRRLEVEVDRLRKLANDVGDERDAAADEVRRLQSDVRHADTEVKRLRGICGHRALQIAELRRVRDQARDAALTIGAERDRLIGAMPEDQQRRMRETVATLGRGAPPAARLAFAQLAVVIDESNAATGAMTAWAVELAEALERASRGETHGGVLGTAP
jgi:hypothetical protein